MLPKTRFEFPMPSAMRKGCCRTRPGTGARLLLAAQGLALLASVGCRHAEIAPTAEAPPMATERSEIPAAGSGNPYLPIPIDEARDALAGEVRLLADCGVDDETLYWSAPDPSTLLGPPDALECVRDRMEGWTMFDAGLRIAFRPSRIVSETFEGTIDVRGISQRMRLKDLKECYEVALREDPELRGRALVGFVIEAENLPCQQVALKSNKGSCRPVGGR